MTTLVEPVIFMILILSMITTVTVLFIFNHLLGEAEG